MKIEFICFIQMHIFLKNNINWILQDEIFEIILKTFIININILGKWGKKRSQIKLKHWEGGHYKFPQRKDPIIEFTFLISPRIRLFDIIFYVYENAKKMNTSMRYLKKKAKHIIISHKLGKMTKSVCR